MIPKRNLKEITERTLDPKKYAPSPLTSKIVLSGLRTLPKASINNGVRCKKTDIFTYVPLPYITYLKNSCPFSPNLPDFLVSGILCISKVPRDLIYYRMSRLRGKSGRFEKLA
jgi:hypothetical protein